MEQYEYRNGPPAPRMVAELAMRHDALVKQLADAQATIAELTKQVEGLEQGCSIHHVDKDQADATIAALQARVRELEDGTSALLNQQSERLAAENEKLTMALSQLTQRTVELHETQNHLADADNEVEQLRKQLSERTAELEAIEKILDIDSGKTTVEKVRDLHHSFKQVWESYQDASNEMFKAQAELEHVRGLIKALPKVEGEITANRVCAIMMHGMYCEEFTRLLQHRQGMEG